MTVPSTTRRAGPFTGTGALAAYPFEFKVFAKQDLAVTIADSNGLETDLVLDSTFTVTLNVDQEATPGGTVNYAVGGVATALPTGYTLVVTGDGLEFEQTADLPQGGNFSPVVIENALDRAVMLLQRLWDGVRRSMRLPDTASDNVSTVLPVPTANNFIGWDSNGTALRNVDPNTLATVVAFAAWQSQAFSGDGVTTQFTLSSDPGNVNNLDVVVGAAPQRNNVDFTLSGVVLTFDVAPANGLSIFCRWGQALPEGTSTLQARLASTASAADNAGLVAFHGPLNYAVRTLGWAVNGLEIDPRWYASANNYVFGNGVVDDFAAIQAAINAIPSAGTGVIKFPRGCTARSSAQIVVSNRYCVIDLQMSSITLTANATSLWYLVGDDITLKNGYLNKSLGVTAECIRGQDGQGHKYEGLISRDQNWSKVFHLVGIRNSIFIGNNIQNNVASHLGNIWELDYCVNNVWVGGTYMFSDQAFYCSSVASPSTGHFCEGVNLLGVVTYGNNKSVTADRVTNLSIGSGCMFDFNLTWGVFATNGNNMSIASGVWIASDTANGFIGVGTGASFEGAVVGACTITRGTTAITGSIGVSLPGPRAQVIGTRFANGMNGGTVTAATSIVLGVQYEGGGTAITAAAATTNVVGALTLNGNTVLSVNALAGAATAGANGAPPAQVALYATVNIGGTNYKIPAYNV